MPHRPYYVTRLFEWSIGFDGTDAFFDHYPELTDLVAPGYRHLGLDGTVDAYERFLASGPAQRLFDDESYLTTDDERAVMSERWEAIGEHDDRIVSKHRPSAIITMSAVHGGDARGPFCPDRLQAVTRSTPSPT